MRASTLDRLDTANLLLKTYFTKLGASVAAHCGQVHQDKDKLFTELAQKQTEDELRTTLIAIRGLTSQSDNDQLSQEEVIGMLRSESEKLSELLDKLERDLTSAVGAFNTRLEQLATSQLLTKPLHFDERHQHKEMTVFERRKVRTTGNGSCYRFAIMKPHLESGLPVRTMTFTILENDQWTAFGVCHHKTV